MQSFVRWTVILGLTLSLAACQNIVDLLDSSPPLKSTKAITAFQFSSPSAVGTIDQAKRTVDVAVPFGTDVRALIPTVDHTGVAIRPSSGVAQDFSRPVTYSVRAENGTSQDYAVTVVVGKSPAKAITSFELTSPSAAGVITESSHTINLVVPFGTAVTALAPVIVHEGGSVSPPSGTAQDFSQPVVYTVTAADSSTQDYTVTVTVQESFFPSTAGYGIRYRVVDSDTTAPVDQYYWFVAQSFVSGLSEPLDRVFTFYPESGFSGSVLGGRTQAGYSRLFAGFPSANQGSFWYLTWLPEAVVGGETYTGGRYANYSVKRAADVVVGDKTYANCIVVSVTQANPTAGKEYTNGSGTLTYANGVGLVSLTFTRDDGSAVSFVLDQTKQFGSTTLSGTVVSGSSPAVGKVVQLANANWGTRAVTDAAGRFSLSMYGPTQVLRVGDDPENTNTFVFTDASPREFWLHNVSGNVTGLTLDLAAPSSRTSLN